LKKSRLLAFIAGLVGALISISCTQIPQRIEGASEGSRGPRYAVDATWPKPLPNNWILGQVAGIATAKDDTIWVIHRPASLTEDERGSTLTPKRSKCCSAAPPVLQFDRAGNLLKSWGGKAAGQGYDWPGNEHGIYVDPKGDVWVGGNAATDG
jgi:hypothetical protein